MAADAPDIARVLFAASKEAGSGSAYEAADSLKGVLSDDNNALTAGALSLSPPLSFSRC